MTEQEQQWRKDFVKIESKLWTKTVDKGGSIYEYAFQIFKAAKQSCAAELAEKDRKIAEQKQYYESVFDDGAKRIAELTRKNAELSADNARMREAAENILSYCRGREDCETVSVKPVRDILTEVTTTPASDWLEQQKKEWQAKALETLASDLKNAQVRMIDLDGLLFEAAELRAQKGR